MAEGRDEDSIAPRRSLGGPILPPPPPALADDTRRTEQEQARRAQEDQERVARDRAEAERATAAKAAAKQAAADRSAEKAARRTADREAKAARKQSARNSDRDGSAASVASSGAASSGAASGGTQSGSQSGSQSSPSAPARTGAPATKSAARSGTGGTKSGPRRTRRAQLRLVQVDAWSVMKTSFLLSIALGIMLVVAVAIIWAVLAAAGVWESINSIVQQAVGGENGQPFDITDYAGASRVIGFTMVVAVIDVILITAIATLGAFLYNLSAALLGGIEVTLAEDS